jgi:hypothetical protein
MNEVGGGGVRLGAMIKCTLCDGIGWVCETHPGKPWH